MNGEAHKLVEEMRQQISSSALSIPQQNAHMARLLVLIAEDMDGQTRRIIRLTWALVILSIALLLFALVQTGIMVKENRNTNAQQVQARQSQKTNREP